MSAPTQARGRGRHLRLPAQHGRIRRPSAHLAGQGGQQNLVIVNTCAVTAESARQARQAIRRLKRERPEARIVVTGCAAQIEPQTFRRHAGSRACDGQCRKNPARQLGRSSRANNVGADRRGGRRDNAPSPLLAAIEGHTRAFLAVQNGCDHSCTFCVIPHGRGPSRSAPPRTRAGAGAKIRRDRP